MKYFYLIALVLVFNFLFAQKEKKQLLKFNIQIANKSLPSEAYIPLTASDSVRIDVFKFYISHVMFLNKGKTVYEEKHSCHLIDITDTASLQISYNIYKNCVYDQIIFHLGVDSITNVSGAIGGALDPTKGMYWAWQSGYINFKLEGKSNLSFDPKKEFQYHLGGYQHPFNALKTVSLAVYPKQKIEIKFDLQQFLNAVDLKKNNHIMSPNAAAIELSEKAAKCFSTR